jgi:hypothetical protein
MEPNPLVPVEAHPDALAVPEAAHAPEAVAPGPPAALVEAGAEALPVVEGEVAPAGDAAPSAETAPVAASTVEVSEARHGREYPSLYDTKATTVLAIVLGVAIVGGIQFMVNRIFTSAKDDHRALTHFVVSMVALIIGAFICDLLISGPDTSLLSSHEKGTILAFTKDTALMIFAYYFGTKSAPTPPSPSAE